MSTVKTHKQARQEYEQAEMCYKEGWITKAEFEAAKRKYSGAWLDLMAQ